MKKRVVVIGAGLCGSVVAALLRNKFHVTLVEQGKAKRPLFDDITCDQGEVNTSINRAEGLGGTTNYWHNALIELDDNDLKKAGIDSKAFARYYAKAWSFFMSDADVVECNRLRDSNHATVDGKQCSIAHMVLPQSRANVWQLASEKYPGDEIQIVYGKAKKIVSGEGAHVVVETDRGDDKIDGDFFIVCAGGLTTPVILAESLGRGDGLYAGYHDHPMAYVAKIKLRRDSKIKDISCALMHAAEVRAGFVYETNGVKTVVYIRPARNLNLRSITGSARYILSDLRNDPFSPKKIFQLLTNLDAVREAILFKSQMGFRGDYYSVLLLGEQTPIPTRGLTMQNGKKPHLNWHVTDEELGAYHASFVQFMKDFAADIEDSATIPKEKWEFRTAAHHSGASGQFLSSKTNGEVGLDFFAVEGLKNAFVCDGSLLRAAGIANSGLTLVGLGHRLAELVSASA